MLILYSFKIKISKKKKTLQQVSLNLAFIIISQFTLILKLATHNWFFLTQIFYVVCCKFEN